MKRKLIRICLPVLMILLAVLWTAPAAASAETIHLPVVEPDSGTPTGQRTTWSCVLFGNYPSAEVVDSSWDAVDGYALRDGDLIRDDNLYARLEAADWENDMTELDGVSYLRVGLDRPPAGPGSSTTDGNTAVHGIISGSSPFAGGCWISGETRRCCWRTGCRTAFRITPRMRT